MHLVRTGGRLSSPVCSMESSMGRPLAWLTKGNLSTPLSSLPKGKAPGLPLFFIPKKHREWMVRAILKYSLDALAGKCSTGERKGS